MRDTAPRSLLGLLLLGALVRIAYLLDYHALPFVDGPLGDSVVYLHQAERVRAGDHGDSSLLAMSPGYGYVLALFGAGWLVIALQSLLGLVGGWALAGVSSRLWAPRSGVAAFSLFIGYGLIPFYESKLLSESLGLVLATAVVVLTSRLEVAEGRFGWALGVGATLGLTILMRAHVIFVAPILLVVAALRWRDEPRVVRARRAAGMALGFGTVLGIRAMVVWVDSGEVVGVLYTAPDAHVVARSTSEAYTGRLDDVGFSGSEPRSAWDVVDAVEEHRLRPDHERGPSGLLATAASIDLRGLAANLPDRVAKTFRDVETTYQYAYYGERKELAALQMLPVTFSLLAWLALAGAIVLGRRDGPRALLPYLPWVLGILTTCVLYMPTARYRFPMVVVLIPLAGVGVVASFDALRSRSRVAAAYLIATLAIGTVTAWRTVTYQPAHPERWHLVIAESLAGQPHDPEALEHHLRSALELSRDAEGRVDPGVEAHVRAIRRH